MKKLNLVVLVLLVLGCFCDGENIDSQTIVVTDVPTLITVSPG